MADEASFEKNQKMTRTEAEKKRQAAATQQLYYTYPLPKNISDMKSYAWGKFTWRDVIASGTAFGVPVFIMLAFQALIPLWLCVIIGAVIGAPLVFLVNKHHFTGDLPIEERMKIYLDNAGQNNLLSWDKTRQNGRPIETATQSFVPEVEFTDDNFVMLPDGTGGFAVIKLDVDDITMSKPTEVLQIVQGFQETLNSLINNTDCTPVQIYLKAQQRKINGYVDRAISDMYRIREEDKRAMTARALDYASLLMALDNRVEYVYDYYYIITYREDAEDVGNDTMNTMSVRRERMKEKMNPLNKKMKAVEDMDYQIGQDRKASTKEFLKQSEFGRVRTKAALTKRVTTALNFIGNIGSTRAGVRPILLDQTELAKLFYEFFNETDKYTVDSVLTQAVRPKRALYSMMVYDDFPELFQRPEDKMSIMDAAFANTTLSGGGKPKPVGQAMQLGNDGKE